MTSFEELARLVERGIGDVEPARVQRQRDRFVKEVTASAPAYTIRSGERLAGAERVPVRLHVRRMAFGRLAAAAAVVLALGGGMWFGAGQLQEETASLSGNGDPEVAPGAARWLEGSKELGPVELVHGAFVKLSPTARARVQGLEGNAPLVTIEGGTLHADLEPGKGRRWRFQAGAYGVEVLGTAFSIEYEPASSAFEVNVTRGRVRVSGGQLGADGITLVAGQRFRAEGHSVSVREQASAQPGEPRPVDSWRGEWSGAQPSAVAPFEARGAASQPAPAPISWHQLFAKGDYAAALAAAEREGFESLVGRLGPAQLAELADAARLSGSSARARQALQTLRSRFPGTPGAATAAFQLGRLEGSPRWFETYLSEQPRGPYAAEAAGRLVVAYRDHGDLGRARTAAERYLAQYPSGPYADLARSLVERPAK
jgi:ferric-dicitrate binding protein FerR (iron transport regulator)